MKIVVTGATGNLGTSTIEALSKDPRVSEIVGVARRSRGTESHNFFAADITRDNLDEIFRGASAVIHLAWLLQPSRDVSRLDRINIGGTRRVLDAISRVKTPQLVVASSVGAYSPGPKDRRVDESWETSGIPSSLYSRQKVQVERMLDEFEASSPTTRVVRMRPGLVFKAEAASEIRRLFTGRWVPKSLFKNAHVPLVPDVERLRFQCVHSRDVGRAFTLAALSDVVGGFNIAANPVLDPKLLSDVLHARRIPMPAALLRQSVNAAWHLRLSPADKGWVDLALEVPLMNTDRAQKVLGFTPAISSTEALLELMAGMHAGQGGNTVPLQPESRAP